MKTNLKRVAFASMVSLISLTVYSQSRESKVQHEKYKSKVSGAQESDQLVARHEDGKHETRDGAYWFNRGYSLHQAESFIEAIKAFTESIRLGHRQATSMYNVACGYALLNDKDNALFWLGRSLAAGFDRPDLLTNDSDLDSLRSDPRFSELIKKVSFTKKEDKHGKDKTISRLEDAINNFEQLQRDASTNGGDWYKIGSRLLRLRDLDRAAAALTQAVEHLANGEGSAMYNLACTYALKGDRALGLEWLEKSINAGFDSKDKLQNDPDIAALRAEPRFKDIQELGRVLSLSQYNNKEFNVSQYSKQRWAPAIKTYESFLRDNPNNGRGWFNLGYALHFSSEHSRAVHAFKQAVRFGYRTPTSSYNVAYAYSMMGNRDAAFEWLDKAVDAGFDLEGYVLADEDLNNLRSDPRFKRFSRMTEGKHKDK